MGLEKNRAPEIVAALRDFASIYEHNNITGYKEIRNAADLIEQLAAEPPNEPLTLEELRGMDGEPVWVTPGGFWALVHDSPAGILLLESSGELAKSEGWMKRMGSIYRRKPDGGGDQ